jgi:hypothetical protein
MMENRLLSIIGSVEEVASTGFMKMGLMVGTGLVKKAKAIFDE